MQNPNTGRPNHNTFYFARSGYGKSQAVIQNPAIPHSGVRTLLFDPNEDYPWTLKFRTMNDFKRAAFSACKMWYRAKRGFRLAYVGEQSPQIHEEWCEFVLSILDGGVETYLVDDEISASVRSAGKAEYYHAKLLNQCRKYGGIYHGSSQKPTETPKTVFDQCAIWWVGNIPASLARRYWEEIGVDNYKCLTVSEPLEFYIKDQKRYGLGAGFEALQYKNPRTIHKRERVHRMTKAA